ncbi:DMT family transporter [Selenomonas noxia]|uniref:DMT family transporter n=1 Tax=Selenomonas noxia TaxID=135083 RepID=UPI0023F30570|nr:DMT family transporter [Selenomonas noxia]
MRRYPLWLMLGLLSGFLWGCNNYLYDIGARPLLEGNLAAGIIIPLVCTAVNDMSAAVSLLLVNGIRGALHAVRTIFRRSGAFLCAAALLGGPLGQLSYCLGILWAGPTYALALSALYPVVGCILARVILHQAITMRMGLGIALAVTGAVLTAGTPSDFAAPLLLPGLVCGLAAAFCWGSEIVLAVRGMEDIEPDLAITLRECISGSALLFMSLIILPGRLIWEEISSHPDVLGSLVAAGIIAGASYFLWYAVNRAIGCARGMALNASYIIWGVLLQWGIGGAMVSGQMILGCGLVFAGVVLVSLYPQKAENIL